MDKREIIEKIYSYEESNCRNSMGCREDWYSPFFCLREAFTMTQLENMSEDELKNLITLAETIGEGLY